MNDFIMDSATAGVTISLLSYGIGSLAKRKWKLSVFNPLLISILLTIAFLKLLHVNYDVYSSSTKSLSYLLTPATVSLAIPLYQKMELLKENTAAILSGILAGVLTSLSSVFLLALLFGLSHEEYVTLLPKSVTTAIGMGISEELGGYVTVTTAVIIITGVFGNMAAERLCRLFKIQNSISRGLAIGAASHVIGTSKAMEMGETEGAMSSLAVVVSGVCTVVGAALFSKFH